MAVIAQTLDGTDFAEWSAQTARLQPTYQQAVQDACEETGLDAREIPAKCPFTLNQLLESNSTLLRF